MLGMLLPWLRTAPGETTLEHEPHRIHSTSNLSFQTPWLNPPVLLLYKFFIITIYFLGGVQILAGPVWQLKCSTYELCFHKKTLQWSTLTHQQFRLCPECFCKVWHWPSNRSVSELESHVKLIAKARNINWLVGKKKIQTNEKKKKQTKKNLWNLN